MTLARAAAVLAGTRAFRGLRHRNYRLFFLGQLISVGGTRMQVTAQGWLVLTLSDDPFLLGVVTAAQFGPLLLFGLFGGLIADGLPKRSTLVVTQAIALVLAALLFATTVTNIVEIWHVIVLAGLLGLVNVVDTPTRHSFTIEMVGRADVANAVALNMTGFNIARVLGPAIAGLLIAAVGTAAVFLVNMLSYGAVIVALALMRSDELLEPPRRRRPVSVTATVADLREGLAYVARTPIVLLAVATLGVVSIFGINFQVLGPPLARDVLGTDAAGYGLLLTAFGIGALGSAFGVAALGTRPRNLAIGAVILGASEIALAGSHDVGLSMGLMVVAGVGAIGMGATGNVTLQLESPDALRGRIMSVYAIVFDGTAPVGALLMGAIAASAGVPAALSIGGLVSVVAGLLVAVRLGQIGRPRPAS